MPFSSDSGKQYIDKIFQRINPKTILDVGAGSGTYCRRYKQTGQLWTGLEVWKPYVLKYGLKNLYDELLVQDAREPISGLYDLAFAGDVLEHMTAEEASDLLTRLQEIAKYVIVSIPIGHYPQDEYDGNPYEKHIKDDWTDAEVRSVFGQPAWSAIDKEIGVYLFTKQENPMKLKIAVYAISKNEEQFVQRFCESAKDADMILIADTGSTDNTVARAIECGAVVHDIAIKPWRFDKARDTALALIPGDYDVCISLDLDEILEPGWREEIERVWTPDTTRLRYKFDWGCGISFYYEKIHHRAGYHWHHPVHEYPRPDGRTKEVYAHTDMLLVSHHPDPTKSRGQYMPLLELAVKEDPHCPRNAFYHARELTFYARWNEAITALNKYLAMPEATWPNERCYAMRLLGKAYDELGNGWEAHKWLRLACAEAPGTREPWVELSMFCYRRSLWLEGYSAAKQALQITDKALVYTMDPSVWGEKPWDLASICAWNLDLKQEAIQLCQKAVEFAPTDSRILSNLQHMTSSINSDVVNHGADQ